MFDFSKFSFSFLSSRFLILNLSQVGSRIWELPKRLSNKCSVFSQDEQDSGFTSSLSEFSIRHRFACSSSFAGSSRSSSGQHGFLFEPEVIWFSFV